MHLDEVVGEVSKRDRRCMILTLLRECIGQPSKSTNRHAHGEVVTLDIAGVDIRRVGVANDRMALTADADSGTVPLLGFFGQAVNLNQLGIVDVIRKRFIDRLNVQLQAITGKLDAVRQTARQVFDKIAGACRIALADQPARDQLGICVNRGPKPSVTRAGILRCNIFRNGLLLAVAERPTLIDLNPFASEVLKNPVLVVSAQCANLADQAHNSLLGDARDANRGADRVAFDKAGDHCGAFGRSEAVHTYIMRYRLRIVKHFQKYSRPLRDCSVAADRWAGDA